MVCIVAALAANLLNKGGVSHSGPSIYILKVS
jgi:hypothetical protein